MSFEEKIQKIKALFKESQNKDAKYYKLIEMGRKLPTLLPEFKVEENRVSGCQSKMYLRSYFEKGKVFFEAEADALISSGLAALLISIYNGETPETILTAPPKFIEEIGIHSALSLSRSNGLFSLHLRMKQEALKYLNN